MDNKNEKTYRVYVDSHVTSNYIIKADSKINAMEKASSIAHEMRVRRNISEHWKDFIGTVDICESEVAPYVYNLTDKKGE